MVSEVRKRSPEADSSHGEHSQSKRAKTASLQSATPYTRPHSKASVKIDSNGDKYWELSKMRRVTISTFRGRTMVNIREYYEKDGQELPGKKGISLPLDQFASLVTMLPEIEAVLKEQGQSIPRPGYTGSDSRQNESSDPDDDEEPTNSPKKNIEATSDEDDDED
ncbi:PC4-domain-containing protein [Aspergillus steynii IBT 23096]|uniref:PC4-domain-containing protein n=1 Tax=Aspergillus steynii IBT 23096 TaxID=1392250 RepID=A0A2I2G297_9EURO|nr:PC4-domain-containing protein [Aspergillus steynii IBT 23096]PLB47013.1 PC4-domain-containing protein [Aspergillus steynii IBT 23096]